MGKWPDFEYHVGKWLKYDRSGYNSSHPSLGSPLDLGNPWRPLATCLKMTILWKTWGVVAASRNPMLLRLETPRFSPVFFTPPLSKEFFRRSKNSRKNQLIPNFTGKREIFSLTCPAPQIFPLSRPKDFLPLPRPVHPWYRAMSFLVHFPWDERALIRVF